MDEVWARAAVVAGALAVAGVVAWIQRWRARRPVRLAGDTGLSPGIYLFTSTGCESCLRARDSLDTELGPTGYHEITWNDDADRFDDIGVDAVPTVLVVSQGGEGRLYPGQPDAVLDELGRV